MRIVSGLARGHALTAPAGSHTRPTADRVREAMFNILSGKIAQAKVLDLFAGSGALGLEALSRGADHCTFVDNDRKAMDVVCKNITALGMQKHTTCLNMDWRMAMKRLSGEQFDLIFIDPPYAKGLYGPVLQEIGTLLARDGLIVVESDVAEEPTYTPFDCVDKRKYGRTMLAFLKGCNEL